MSGRCALAVGLLETGMRFVRVVDACVCQYVSMSVCFFASSQILTHNCPLTGSTVSLSHEQQWRRWCTGLGPLPVCRE